MMHIDTIFEKKNGKKCEIQGAQPEKLKNPRWPPLHQKIVIFGHNFVSFGSFNLVVVSWPVCDAK